MVRFFLFCEARCLAILDRHWPRLGALLRRYHRVAKYITAGGTAAAVDLGLLYLLTDIARLHYLVSATLAFIVAFWVSFILQKFWTFGDDTRDRIHTQAVVYFVIAVANVGVNALLMYLFVSVFGIWYFLAQIIAGALIACYSFLIYRRFVFRTQIHPSTIRRGGGTGHGADDTAHVRR